MKMTHRCPALIAQLKTEVTPVAIIRAIYGRGIVTFNGSNFQAAKKQLLDLLDIIIKKEPKRAPGLFKKFKEFKATVDNKLRESCSMDLKREVLKGVKTSLEDHFESICRNPRGLTSKDLSSYQVNLCLAGACSNILAIADLFYPPLLSRLFADALKSVICQVAQDTIPSSYHSGDEIHEVNRLYNGVASQYGLSREEDILASAPSGGYHTLSHFSPFKTALKNKSMVDSVLVAMSDACGFPVSSTRHRAFTFNQLNDFFEGIVPNPRWHPGLVSFWHVAALKSYNFVPKDGYNLDDIVRCFFVVNLGKSGFLENYKLPFPSNEIGAQVFELSFMPRCIVIEEKGHESADVYLALNVDTYNWLSTLAKNHSSDPVSYQQLLHWIQSEDVQMVEYWSGKPEVRTLIDTGLMQISMLSAYNNDADDNDKVMLRFSDLEDKVLNYTHRKRMTSSESLVLYKNAVFHAVNKDSSYSIFIDNPEAMVWLRSHSLEEMDLLSVPLTSPLLDNLLLPNYRFAASFILYLGINFFRSGGGILGMPRETLNLRHLSVLVGATVLVGVAAVLSLSLMAD